MVSLGRMGFRSQAAVLSSIPTGIPPVFAEHHTPKRRHVDFDGVVVSDKVWLSVRVASCLLFSSSRSLGTVVTWFPRSLLFRCKSRLSWL